MVSTDLLKRDPKIIENMFDQVANRYDLLNRLLSFNSDQRFRKTLVNTAQFKPGQLICDCACGTGDLSILLAMNHLQVDAYDISQNMLDLAKTKISQRKLSNQITLYKQDITNFSKHKELYDGLTISFGLRNLPDIESALKQFNHLLKKEGKLLILDFTTPPSKFINQLSKIYLNKIGIFLSKLFNRKAKFAYEYLPTSVAHFPTAEKLKEHMQKAGFEQCLYKYLNFGLVALHIGVKK